jgi:hypothetical protein
MIGSFLYATAACLLHTAGILGCLRTACKTNLRAHHKHPCASHRNFMLCQRPSATWRMPLLRQTRATRTVTPPRQHRPRKCLTTQASAHPQSSKPEKFRARYEDLRSDRLSGKRVPFTEAASYPKHKRHSGGGRLRPVCIRRVVSTGFGEPESTKVHKKVV